MQKTTPLLLRFIRLFHLLMHVASGLLQSIVYPYFPLHIQRRMMQHWATGLLSILHIKLQCHGRLPGAEVPHALFAANHVSWLDVCVLMAVCPTRFVAKADISHWPVLGLLSRNAGTLFIERAKRSDTARINQQISDVLEKGERVAVFPEGPTADGTQLNHFHASLLQSAVVSDALLYPVAIGYRNMAGNICAEAAYLFTTAHHEMVDEVRKGSRSTRMEEHHEEIRTTTQGQPDLQEVLRAGSGEAAGDPAQCGAAARPGGIHLRRDRGDHRAEP